MPRGFYIAVEDDLSDAVARKLLEHVRRGFHVIASYPLRDLPYLRAGPSGYGFLRKNVNAFNQAAARTPHLPLTDLDETGCAPELIREWHPLPLHPNFLLRVAVREIETWLPADAANRAGFLGVGIGHIPAHVETVGNPKEEIVRLAALSPNAEVQRNLVPRSGSTAKTGRLFNRTPIGYARN